MNLQDIQRSPQFLELCQLVRQEIARLEASQPDRREALLAEKRRLEQEQAGRLQSLANPQLGHALRTILEQQTEESLRRLNQLSLDLTAHDSHAARLEESLDPAIVAEHFAKLESVLSGENASATNLMLSFHIDGIYCKSDKSVVVRTCKLGALADSIDILRQPGSPATEMAGQIAGGKSQPRRRGRLNVGDAFEDDEEAITANDFAMDPKRFAGLGPEWFDEVIFVMPERKCWAETHAIEIANYRLAKRVSIAKTAEHFETTTPTIHKALKFAKALGIDATGEALKLPKGKRWAEKNWDRVAAYFDRSPRPLLKDAAADFKVSVPTINNALRIANEQRPVQQDPEATGPAPEAA